MTDRRLTPANGRVAHERLRGRAAATRFVAPMPHRVRSFATFLHDAPGGLRDRELVHGDLFDVLEVAGDWAFGEAGRDGYVGYLAAADLAPAAPVTHAVRVRQTHLYPEPSMKSAPRARLPFGAALAIHETSGKWARSGDGHVPAAHLRGLDEPMNDPVAVAELFLGTPYLWAGNTGDGIDCSGLVQGACLACGIDCPGDSDLQEASLGHALPPDEPLRRGDLLFWPGHVAWVAGPDLLLHANACAMAVSYEEIGPAVARIMAQGDGAVTSRRRLGLRKRQGNLA